MNPIIITENIADGIWLKDALCVSSNSLRFIENISKDEVLASPEKYKGVTYIFSTWHMPVFSEAEIKNYFPLLKYIYYIAGSVEYFVKPFENCGITVVSAIEENSVPVAEFVVAQIVLANKGVFESQRCYKKPFWKLSFSLARRYPSRRIGNYRARVGLIGLGRVGLKVLQLLKDYDFEIYICDPKVSNIKAKDMGAENCDLVKIFEKCDVISNHLPDIPSTKDILNINLFSIMKQNVVFINTGRGAQVVEKDLVKAMRSKPYSSALLDVTRREPPLPWSPLLWTRNIFLTPHIAGSQSFEYQRMVDAVVRVYHSNDDHNFHLGRGV
jgi:phosphoglycerate dehydrogenase-like enzyme